MEDLNHSFSVGATVERIKKALRIETDREVAKMLGMAPNTLANRMSRNSMPTEQVNALCGATALNPEWVFTGKGEIYSGDHELRRRLQLRDDVYEALMPLGLPAEIESSLRLVLAHAIAGNRDATIHTWRSIGSALDQKEKNVLTGYRNASDELRVIFESLVTVSAVQKELGLSGMPKLKGGEKMGHLVPAKDIARKKSPAKRATANKAQK